MHQRIAIGASASFRLARRRIRYFAHLLCFLMVRIRCDDRAAENGSGRGGGAIFRWRAQGASAREAQVIKSMRYSHGILPEDVAATAWR
ncbi:hypothetical protein [Mixta calida]|uniref:hypothetical protein n=1 Tax=Mixta calida TaxID=665913 RepID=UPI00105465C6|nr:hypothetical protein [Mixta calida]MBS6058526.1 hypothetical protein [Pantoea sp.]MDU5828776.1 hypothetical protein [Mixta calida]